MPAIRSALSFLALPQNAPLAAELLYRTVDDIWFACGDRSTDWNFYSKRGLLAGVYSSTLMVWLNDESEDFETTRRFLDRRIGNVMAIPKITGRAKKLGDIVSFVPRRLKAFRTFRPAGARRG
jgi:ubiquinone biosynthesis protein COQ9